MIKNRLSPRHPNTIPTPSPAWKPAAFDQSGHRGDRSGNPVAATVLRNRPAHGM
jgi:hypothetical protein